MGKERDGTGTERHAENYFEYEVIAGPWRGADARLIAQSTDAHDTLDVEVRRGKSIRGPFRIRLDWLKWRGPKG